jgi:mannosyltransferase
MRFDQRRGDPICGAANLSPQAKHPAAAGSWRPDLALAAGLSALALALRLYGLANKPFWYDEILTWGRAKLPLGELVINTLKHKHFPTYFLLASPFASAAHDPEWMLRLPSVLFGAACVFGVTRLACDARGLRAGLVAGLLMALSPIEVAFAQDARPYTLISCLVLIATWGLLRIAQNPRAASRRIGQPGALRAAWIAYGVGTVGALLVENNTIPFLLASNIAIAVILLRADPAPAGLLRNWTCTQGLIAIIWLPAILIMWWINRGAVLEGLQWIPKPTWQAIHSTAEALYLFRISDMMTLNLLPGAIPQFGVLVAIAALFGAWRLKSDPNVLAVIGLAFLTMPLAVLALAAFQPLLVPRYLLWSTGPFFVLAGVGTAAVPGRFFAPTALAVAIGGAVSLAPYYGAETKPRWNEALSYLAQRVRPGDVVIAQNETVEYFLAAYAGRFGLPPPTPIFSWNPHDPGDTVRRALAAERDWIVYGRVGQGAQEPEAEFRRKWSDFGTPAEQIRFGSSILILRFDRSPERQEVIEPGAVSSPKP